MLESYANVSQIILAPKISIITRASTELNYHMRLLMPLAMENHQTVSSESSLRLPCNDFPVLRYPTAHKSVKA